MPIRRRPPPPRPATVRTRPRYTHVAGWERLAAGPTVHAQRLGAWPASVPAFAVLVEEQGRHVLELRVPARAFLPLLRLWRLTTGDNGLSRAAERYATLLTRMSAEAINLVASTGSAPTDALVASIEAA